MYARIARFTGGDPDAIERNVAEIRSRVESGPPEGVPAVGFRFCVDKANGTVVAISFFQTEEDLRKGDATLNEMSPPEGSMGTRSSVDLCSVEVSADA
jgi:hypothetical protein